MFFLWNNIFRYYHDNRNFTRLLTMLSNEVVARARKLVGEHVLENLLAVSKKAVLWTCFDRVTTPCEQSPFLSPWGRTRKGGSAWIASSLWSCRSPKFWTLALSRQTGCFEHEHSFIDKLMIIIEPTVPSTRLLGLSLKLYRSNMKCTLNNNLPRFMKSLSQVRQNRVSERDALLAGLSHYNLVGS